MKLNLAQYVLSLKMDEEKKSELLKAVCDRDDWEIVPWGYIEGHKHRSIDVVTRDNKFIISNVPVGYFGKDKLLEAIETLYDRIEDMKIDYEMNR